MNVRELVNELRNQGHKVVIYERKDGGILIKELDGVKYTGANGNNVARALLGQTLSTKRKVQLQEAQRRRTTQNEELNSLLKKVQRKWSKRFGNKKQRHAKGKSNPGDITSKKVRWLLEHKGFEEAKQALIEAEKYAEGIAYSKNVEYLLQEMEKMERKLNSKNLDIGEWSLCCDYISEIQDQFREDWIQPIWQILYEMEKLIANNQMTKLELQEFTRQVKAIIRLP